MSDASPHPATVTQRALKWTIFLAATALILYWCLLIVRPFLNVIAWSSVLVIAFHPVYRRLVRKTGRVTGSWRATRSSTSTRPGAAASMCPR
jgi:predicted PurR-regulated permease PerM